MFQAIPECPGGFHFANAHVITKHMDPALLSPATDMPATDTGSRSYQQKQEKKRISVVAFSPSAELKRCISIDQGSNLIL